MKADWQSIAYIGTLLASAIAFTVLKNSDIATILVGAAVGAPVATRVLRKKGDSDATQEGK